jgi:hypothetical protein
MHTLTHTFPTPHAHNLIHILTLLNPTVHLCSPCAAVVARTALRSLLSLRAASHTSRGGLLRGHRFATSCGLSPTLTHTLLAPSVFHSRNTHHSSRSHTHTHSATLYTHHHTPHASPMHTTPRHAAISPAWLKSSASAFRYICDSILTTRLKFASFVHSFMLLWNQASPFSASLTHTRRVRWVLLRRRLQRDLAVGGGEQCAACEAWPQAAQD